MKARTFCRQAVCTSTLAAFLATAGGPGASAAPRHPAAAPTPGPKRGVAAPGPEAKRAGAPVPGAPPVPEKAGPTILATPGFRPIQQYRGDLTLDTAVDIALHQNPDILNALQEIQRTRGLILEIRANALPNIVASSAYSQQERQLLRGGGFATAQQGGRASNLSSTALASTQPTTTQTTTGDVGNTNTAGTGLGSTTTGVGGSGGSSGNGTGLSAARAERPTRTPTATVVDPGTGTDTGTTTGNNATGDAGDVLSQVQSALAGSVSNSGSGIQDKSWNVSVQVQQVLYTGGALTAAIRIANLQQDTAYYRLRDTVDRIIAQVRQQFYTVLLNRELIGVAEEAVRLANQQLTDQRNRFEAGTVPRFNVLRAEVEVANAQPVLIRTRNDYLLARIQLAKALGLSPGNDGQPDFTCVGSLTVSRRLLSLTDALQLARARRPFLKVQRQSILVNVEGIKIEFANYKPQFNAQGGYTLRNDSRSDDLGEVANGWFFGVSGNWNVFDGFQTYGRVKQARARLEQSKITYFDSVRQVDLEVQSSYANLEQARQTIESQQKNVESAVEALRLAQERFTAGAGTQLEVLDARVALTRARTTELQARSDFARNLAEFDRVTATQTSYHDKFRDPLEKVEGGILAKIAETGLPKLPSHRHDHEHEPERE